jgi:hypothetical protein
LDYLSKGNTIRFQKVNPEEVALDMAKRWMDHKRENIVSIVGERT